MQSGINLFFPYIKYLLSAKTKHGLHSPFVYKLYTEAILKKEAPLFFKSIEDQRKKLLKDNSVLEIQDLGAGSTSGLMQRRLVKEIAKHSLKNKKYAQLIYNLVEYFKPTTILEFGTSLGITTSYMAKAQAEAAVLSMEGGDTIAEVAKKNINDLGIKNAEVVTGSFDEKINYCIEKLKKLDFVFIDGNHKKEATLTYFEKCLAASHNGTVFVFDDIRWSKGMMEAWEIIKERDEVTVTLDLFFMGIVFIRKDQAKEHFVIRY